ncbi:hypothetical protein [Sessilibacter corallicola]|uniref:hypothetical protein n=1 Tax=Sessilibacter corallicola TaxID=2904075 RepID=UPI001E460410|nr:hypothetical protein [Sessilibacter corallicola]MCE2030276.1 hypothetical protein [Sessilibacter corallicola]
MHTPHTFNSVDNDENTLVTMPEKQGETNENFVRFDYFCKVPHQAEITTPIFGLHHLD